MERLKPSTNTALNMNLRPTLEKKVMMKENTIKFHNLKSGIYDILSNSIKSFPKNLRSSEMNVHGTGQQSLELYFAGAACTPDAMLNVVGWSPDVTLLAGNA